MRANLIGVALLLAYYFVFAAVIPGLLKLVRVPTELVRKTQHVVYALSVFLMLKLFTEWYWSLVAGLVLVVAAYPVLWWFERKAWLARLLVCRSGEGGELRRQLLWVQLTFGILILVFWGLLGYRWQYVVAAAAMAWGFGDAAAALFGKAFGRRRIVHRLIEGTKTYVGLTAMAVAAALALLLTLRYFGNQLWSVSIGVAVIVAPICAVVELFSRRGADTITVPLVAAALTAPLVYVFSLFGK